MSDSNGSARPLSVRSASEHSLSSVKSASNRDNTSHNYESTDIIKDFSTYVPFDEFKWKKTSVMDELTKTSLQELQKIDLKSKIHRASSVYNIKKVTNLIKPKKSSSKAMPNVLVEKKEVDFYFTPHKYKVVSSAGLLDPKALISDEVFKLYLLIL